MPNKPRNNSAGIIALFLVAVLSAGTLITSYVNPFLFERFEETGNTSGGKGSEGKEDSDGKKTAEGKEPSTPEEILEGVNIQPVIEDDSLIMAQVGDSKALDLEPWEGLRISAGENAMDYDREVKVERLSDETYASEEAFLEDGGIILVDAFDLDAGLSPEECIPGQFDIEIDLENLGIPEDMYENVAAMRRDANGNRFYYARQIENGTLKFSSNQNSFLEVVVVLVIAGSITMGIKAYQSSEDERYMDDKTRRTYYKKDDNFMIVWAAEDLDDKKVWIEDVLNEQDRIREEIKKNHPRVDAADFFGGRADGKTYEEAKKERRDAMIAEYKKAIAESAVIKQYNLQEITPDYVESVAVSARRSFEFLKSQNIRLPSYTITIYLRPHVDGSDAEQHLRFILNPTIAVSMQKTFAEGAEAMEELPITMCHELFHACQHQYYTGEMIGKGANVRLFEALAGAIEPYAYKYFDSKGYFPTIKGLDVKKDWEELMTHMTTRSHEHFLALEPDDQTSEPQHAGYVLAYLIEYLNKVAGEKSFHWILMNYMCGRDLTKCLKEAYGLDDENFRLVYLNFLKWMRKNRCPVDGYNVSAPLCEIIDLSGALAPEKTKFEIKAKQDMGMPYLRTVDFRRSKDTENPKALFVVPVKDEGDFCHEVTPRGGSFNTPLQYSGSDPGSPLFWDASGYWPGQQLIEVADVGKSTGSKFTGYVLIPPQGPKVTLDEDYIHIKAQGFPDLLAKEFKEKKEELKDFEGGISVVLVRDDGEKFELDQIYEPKYWEEEIKVPVEEEWLSGYNGDLQIPTFSAILQECVIIEDTEYYGPESKKPESDDIYGTWAVEVQVPNFGSAMIDQAYSLRPGDVREQSNDEEYWQDYKQDVTSGAYHGTMMVIPALPPENATVTDGVEYLTASLVYTDYTAPTTNFAGNYVPATGTLTMKQTVDTTVYDAETAKLMEAYMPELTLYVTKEEGTLKMSGGSSLNTSALSYEFQLSGVKED